MPAPTPSKIIPGRHSVIVELVGPQAWVVDDTGFAKNGSASPGVARQYSGRWAGR